MQLLDILVLIAYTGINQNNYQQKNMIPFKIYAPCLVYLLCFVIATTISCNNQSHISEQPDVPESLIEDEKSVPGIVEVKAVGLTLEAEDEIPSGWTTFKFINESDMIHLAFLYKLPEGKRIADHKDLAPIFQNFMDQINGRPLSDPEAGLEIPEWFGEVVTFGGPGLLSKNSTSETTVYIEPGVYLMECYVKTDGIFHSYNSSPTESGMVHEFTVTDENNGAYEPEPSINISISGENGMTVTGDIASGNHMVRVDFVDQKPHENFQGHDVHLVQLLDDSEVSQIVKWVDWREPTGLQTPAPSANFLGGTNELPAGGTAYFSINLKPGRFMWISEVPNADGKGLLVEFEVVGVQ